MLFVFTPHASLAPTVSTGYAIAFLYLFLPLEALLANVPRLQQARVATEKLSALLERLAVPSVVWKAASSREAVREEVRSTLALENVTHSYCRDGDESDVPIGPIDLTIRRGEAVFVVGGNGSGKTTLVKLITGSYAPQSGTIRVDGVAIADPTSAAYRGNFSAFFSDFHLFERTFGLDVQRVQAEAPRFLAELQLEHKVSIVDGRFSSLKLSQGQRKRLALAVALLEDRPVYVFDEWAADQDPAYNSIFYRRLLPELRAQRKAVVVITHDDAYFALADRIVRLASGRIVDAERWPRPDVESTDGSLSRDGLMLNQLRAAHTDMPRE